jgi:hypothetical protein
MNISNGVDTSKKEKMFVVSLNGVAPWISQVRYKKNEKDLKLYFTIIVGDASNSHNSDVSQLPLETTSLPALAGRLLTKLEFLEGKNLYMAAISKDEWQECRANAQALKESVKHAQDYIGEQASLLLLYEEPGSAHPKGLLWTKRKEFQEAVLNMGTGFQKGNWTLLSFPDQKIEAIPNRIRQTL